MFHVKRGWDRQDLWLEPTSRVRPMRASPPRLTDGDRPGVMPIGPRWTVNSSHHPSQYSLYSRCLSIPREVQHPNFVRVAFDSATGGSVGIPMQLTHVSRETSLPRRSSDRARSAAQVSAASHRHRAPESANPSPRYGIACRRRATSGTEFARGLPSPAPRADAGACGKGTHRFG